jgi:hypothetical protein
MPAAADGTEDGVIEDERAHLARSREFLHLMRENALELAKNPMAGDRVSLEFLKADLYRRAEALKDLPDAPLFFGRLDYSELAREEVDFAGADFHIGRRHVHDPDGTPVVLDWRAPVSVPFYRASQPDPMGLTLRRRFGFAGGELTAYEDERFKGNAEAGATPVRSGKSDFEAPSNLLISEIERPRSGPMRDIVATIQPEQDDIVRAGAATTVCVQGAPGTGKTAVGLHRVAYLLYAHKEQVTRRGVVVVGPNLAFLSYIRNVLPALGELDVTQTTVADLVASTPIRATDTDEAAAVQGDARMAELLRDRRDLRRPHPRLRPPVRAGPQVRGRGLAEGRSQAAGFHRPFRSRSAHIERTGPTVARRVRPHPLAEDPARPRLGPLDPRRPGADRRGDRSHRAHAVDRARGGGRGAGPLADGGARDRPAVRDRGRDRARRHRPGHHPVGGDLVARAAAAPGQARGGRP